MKWYGTRTGINYPLSNNKKSNRVVSSGFLPWPIFFIFCSEFVNIWSLGHHLCFVTVSPLINLGSTKKPNFVRNKVFKLQAKLHELTEWKAAEGFFPVRKKCKTFLRKNTGSVE